MTRRFFTIILLLVTSYTAYSQTFKDSIKIRETFFGPVFTQYNATVLPGEMIDRMQSNPQAVAEMKLAKRNYNISTGIGLAGGALIAYPVVQLLRDKNPQWIYAAAGGGVMLAAVPFSLKYKKQARNAVSMYNAGLSPKTGNASPEMKLDFGFQSIGFRLTF